MDKGQMWQAESLWLCGSWSRAINMETGAVGVIGSGLGQMFEADTANIVRAFREVALPLGNARDIDSLPAGCIFNAEGDNFLKVSPFIAESGAIYTFCTFDGTFLPSSDCKTNHYARWKLHVLEELQPEIRLASEVGMDEERYWEEVSQPVRRTRRPHRPS